MDTKKSKQIIQRKHNPESIDRHGSTITHTMKHKHGQGSTSIHTMKEKTYNYS